MSSALNEFVVLPPSDRGACSSETRFEGVKVEFGKTSARGFNGGWLRLNRKRNSSSSTLHMVMRSIPAASSGMCPELAASCLADKSGEVEIRLW